jgi:peptidoglycan/xylan/chitin deacetylase (PgdA/CDA1 family)
MRIKHFKYYVLAILLTTQLAVYGQLGNQPVVRVAKFYGDRAAAICYSFDDGLKNQADIGLPLLDKYGFKGTFFIIPAIIPTAGQQILSTGESRNGTISWERLSAMAANGHEVASHSWSHKNMKPLSDPVLHGEIDKADQAILKEIGHFPLTFAYPYNSFDERVHNAVRKNHLAARESQFGIGPRFTAQNGNDWADGLVKKGDWGIAMIHGITIGFDALSSPQVLDDHFKYVKALETKIWVATFANISKYIAERDSVRLDVKIKGKSATIRAVQPLDRGIYNQPLTIVVEAMDARSAEARQKGRNIPVRVENGRITFDVVPGTRPVIVKWDN